jgi:hypothetical protein
MSQVINLATDFSKFPTGRYRDDSDFSGEQFRDEILIPALSSSNDTVELVIDGVAGLPSSFLEEVAGGLVRKGYPEFILRKRLIVVAKSQRMSSYINEFWKHVVKASKHV